MNNIDVYEMQLTAGSQSKVNSSWKLRQSDAWGEQQTISLNNRDIVGREIKNFLMDLCYKLNDKFWASENNAQTVNCSISLLGLKLWSIKR